MSAFRTDEGIDQVRLALEAYVEFWNSGRVSGLRRFWDLQHPEPVYVAEEQEALAGPVVRTFCAAPKISTCARKRLGLTVAAVLVVFI